MKKPLWITGIGCLSAAGIGVVQTRRTFFSPDGGIDCHLSILDETEAQFLKLKLRPEWREKFTISDGPLAGLFALLAVEEAMASADLTPDDLKSLRVGVCLGSTVGATNYDETFARAFYGGKLPTPESLMAFFHTNSAQFISRLFKLNGPTMMINNACTSGADAIAIGASWLANDLCDLVICGGTENILAKIYYGFRSLMLNSPTRCKPFDKNRSGLTLGEGAAITVLEKPDSSRTPKALLLGYGMGSDASHPTAPHPAARGLGRAAEMALDQAGLKSSQIDFINAHGTATPHNDLAEGQWLKKNFDRVPITATKGYTGHTLGAAGALEAVFTVLSLIENRLPASRGFVEADPEIGVVPTLKIESGDYRAALSFSLGFGGTNAALCLGRVV